jgi:hypothetical protein
LGGGGGVAGFGGEEISGVCSRRGAGAGLESRSDSDSDAVDSSALNTGACGEGLFFFVFETGGETSDLASWALSWGGVSCR